MSELSMSEERDDVSPQVQISTQQFQYFNKRSYFNLTLQLQNIVLFSFPALVTRLILCEHFSDLKV